MNVFSKGLAAVGVIAVAATAMIPSGAAMAAPAFRWQDNQHATYNNYRGYNQPRPGYQSYNGFWFPPAAFIAGAIIGGALSQQQPQQRSYAYVTQHTNWCQQRYRSYNIASDTFTGYDGYTHYCVSPYSY